MEKYTKYFIFLWILIIFVLNLMYTGYVLRQKASVEAENTKLQLQQAGTIPTLPVSAVKVSECIPHMGEHWVAPEDIPNGPFYLVSKNKILGLEYMFALDEIPGQLTANMSLPEFIAYMEKNNLSLGDVVKTTSPKYDLHGTKFTNFSFEWSSPHAGQPKPHYDIHLYLADQKELDLVCPNATVQDAVSPEVIENIQRNNIPFPEGPKPPSSTSAKPLPTATP